MLAASPWAGLVQFGLSYAHQVRRSSAIAATDIVERYLDHGRPSLVPNRYVRFSRTEQAILGDAPGVGEHSRAVLAEAGLSEAEIDALVDQRVMVHGSPLILKGLVSYP